MINQMNNMKNLFLVLVSLLFITVVSAQSTKVIYTCVMHPEVKMDKPGKCPKCGMDLNLSTKEQMKAGTTKNYSCPIHLDVTKHDPGKCPKCGRKLNLSQKEQMKAEVVKLYTCPMHPEVALDKDGKCPKCGAELVEKKQKK